MAKLQKIIRKNGSSIYLVYLDPKEIDFMKWEKQTNLNITYSAEQIIITREVPNCLNS
jgi:dihydroorotase